jgi:hypothetical protein
MRDSLYWQVATMPTTPTKGACPIGKTLFWTAGTRRSTSFIRFPEAREVQTEAAEKVRVCEMIIVLRGNIWVRFGDKAKEHGKHEHGKAIRLQQVLKEAEAVK